MAVLVASLAALPISGWAAERVTLTTDCGMKQLPRYNAVKKLEALVAGARIVRRELTVSS